MTSDTRDITRWREDMNFMFEWQKQCLTGERRERVRERVENECFCPENIKFISLSQRVMCFLLRQQKLQKRVEGTNRV